CQAQKAVSQPGRAKIQRRTTMNITDKTIWVVAPEVRSVPTSDGLTLLDSEREMYCDLALLAASVWLLIEWTPAGITVKEIVDLLETAAPLPRNMLETETCGVVADLARNRFVRKRPSGGSVSERRNVQADAAECLDKLRRMGLLQANGHGMASCASGRRK